MFDPFCDDTAGKLQAVTTVRVLNEDHLYPALVFANPVVLDRDAAPAVGAIFRDGGGCAAPVQRHLQSGFSEPSVFVESQDGRHVVAGQSEGAQLTSIASGGLAA